MASFTIDPVNRLIILDQIAPDVNGFVVIDVQIDLYSEMKLFWKDNILAHGLIFPWTAVGGTPYGGGRFQGTDYFLRNDLGWRIRPYEADHELQINGNLRPTLITEATIIPTIGDFVVYAPQERSGVFQVVETVSGSGVTEQDKLDIADRVWDEDARDHSAAYTEGAIQQHLVYARVVHIDTLSANTGTAFPVGTDIAPVNNWADAKDIADAHGITEFHIEGTLIIGATDVISDYTLAGPHQIDALLILTPGCTTQNTRIRNLILTGTLNGKVNILECTILALINFKGFMQECVLADNITVVDPATPSLISGCGSGRRTPPIEIDIGDAALAVGGWKGSIMFTNKTGIGSIFFEMMVGRIEIDSTCVAGSIMIAGMGIVVDNSGAGCTVDTTNLHSKEETADAVWNKTLP